MSRFFKDYEKILRKIAREDPELLKKIVREIQKRKVKGKKISKRKKALKKKALKKKALKKKALKKKALKRIIVPKRSGRGRCVSLSKYVDQVFKVLRTKYPNKPFAYPIEVIYHTDMKTDKIRMSDKYVYKDCNFERRIVLKGKEMPHYLVRIWFYFVTDDRIFFHVRNAYVNATTDMNKVRSYVDELFETAIINLSFSDSGSTASDIGLLAWTSYIVSEDLKYKEGGRWKQRKIKKQRKLRKKRKK